MTDLTTPCVSPEEADPIPTVAEEDILSFDVIPPAERPVGATATLEELGVKPDADGVHFDIDEASPYMAPSNETYFTAVMAFRAALMKHEAFRDQMPINLFGDPNKTGGVYAVPAGEYSPDNPPGPDALAIKII